MCIINEIQDRICKYITCGCCINNVSDFTSGLHYCIIKETNYNGKCLKFEMNFKLIEEKHPYLIDYMFSKIQDEIFSNLIII